MSQKQIPTVIGIDIGCLTAKIGAVDKGAITIVTNEANSRQTPVVIGYGDGERKIGEMGQVKLKSNFKNTVLCPFRYLGLKGNSADVKKQLLFSPCQTQWKNDILYFKVKIDGKEHLFTAQQVMATFITQLSEILNFNNYDDKRIVLSVPSFFTEIEKRALLNAAQISGVKNVRLVTETVASGLDYGSFKKSEFQQGKNVVFVDFGYAKLTVSLIRFLPDKMEVLLQRSNRNLGCRDIDQKVFQFLAKKFEQKTGLNIYENKRACLKLIDVIQKQRKILSGVTDTDISVECLMQQEDINEPLTRQTMQSLSSEVFAQITNLLQSFKTQIEKQNIRIDSVEMVGGGSRIPRFIETVENVFKMAASRTTNSSENIAEGTTLAAVQFSNLFRLHSFKILNRSAHKIRVSWKQAQSTMQAQSPSSQAILELGQLIPVQKDIKISTSNKIQLLVFYEGLQSQMQDKIAKIICEKPLNGNEINLKFEVTEEQFVILKSARDAQGNNIKFTVQNHKVLSPQQISQFKTKQKQMFVRDYNIVKCYQKKNNLQSFIYKQQEVLNEQEIKKFISKQDKQNFERLVCQAKQCIERDGDNMKASDYDNKKLEIEKAIKNLRESSKRRKGELLLEIKKLEDLKAYASDTMKLISQRYRNTQKVVEVYNKIKEIEDWAEQAIQVSKSKQINELPIVPQKDINQQYENIKILVNHLVNPGYPQPNDRMQQGRTRPQDQNLQPGYNPYQQQARKGQQQLQHHPYGMSRSGFFNPGNIFGNIGGFY